MNGDAVQDDFRLMEETGGPGVVCRLAALNWPDALTFE